MSARAGGIGGAEFVVRPGLIPANFYQGTDFTRDVEEGEVTGRQLLPESLLPGPRGAGGPAVAHIGGVGFHKRVKGRRKRFAHPPRFGRIGEDGWKVVIRGQDGEGVVGETDKIKLRQAVVTGVNALLQYGKELAVLIRLHLLQWAGGVRLEVPDPFPGTVQSLRGSDELRGQNATEQP